MHRRDEVCVSDPACTLPLSRTAIKEVLVELTPVKRTIDTRTGLDSFSFTNYCFPPGLEAVRYIDTTRLNKLTLDSCNNVGFLFNGLLCNLSQIHLKKLVISQSQNVSAIGYIGREKIECFLIVHKGLEEIGFSDMGEDRPSLSAILTQGRSLRVLKLYESRGTRTSEARTREKSNEVEDVARICKACPLLERLIIVQGCSCGNRECCCKPNTQGNMCGPDLIHKSSPKPQSRHMGLQTCSTTV